MKRFLFIIAISAMGMVSFSADAVKANPNPQTVTMPDGTTATVRLAGDEYCHYFQAENGYPVVRKSDGFFYYLRAESSYSVLPSEVRVGSLEETDFLRNNSVTSIFEALENQALSPGYSKKMRSKSYAPGKRYYPTTGKGRGLVVLVDYQDVKFQSSTANSDFSRMLNEPGYADFNANGSAADWFRENSMGVFDPVFDVVGPVTLPYDMAYYGKNVGGDDQNAHMMVVHACDILDNEIDFTDYDMDGDGYIDNVFIFYAGYGENLGALAPSESVWPHSWDLEEATTTPYFYDGVKLNHYACSNEKDLDNIMDGIGTFCHEFSHVLGLPDLYATNYSSAFTPGEWSVMDCGNYLNNSRTPPYYSAYERYFLGWINPRELTRPANVKLDNIATNSACIIRTEKENEYFLLENRQNKDWDAYLPHHGMLIWHIDFNENVWKYNTVNNSRSHQYVDIEEADNIQSDGTRDGDCFPGVANVTSFTDETVPGMLSWDGVAQNKPITDIRESNGYIYFSVCGGVSEAAPVVATEAQNIGVTSFTASWQPGEEGYEYYLNVFITKETEAGKSLVEYVKGYENLPVGSVNKYDVTGLKPATLYHYTVTAFDTENELYSVPSNQIDITTLDPTFDYLTPEIISVEDLGSSSFTLRWNPMEEADSYILDLYTHLYGEAETETVDFTGGLSALPEGWETPSSFTYGAEDYAGQAVPSLRLNSSASYISSAEYMDGIRSLSFWYRAVGCTPADRIVIETLADGVWLKTAELEIESAPEGVSVTFDNLPENPEWPGFFTSFRISLLTDGKGAIAIDDIKTEFGGNIERVYSVLPQGIDIGNGSSFTIEGLLPATAYWVTLTGRKGDIFSYPSVEKRVITLAADKDAVGVIINPSFSIRVSGTSVFAEGLEGTYFSAFSADGSLAARSRVVDGAASLSIASKGFYIVSDGKHSSKITIK